MKYKAIFLPCHPVSKQAFEKIFHFCFLLGQSCAQISFFPLWRSLTHLAGIVKLLFLLCRINVFHLVLANTSRCLCLIFLSMQAPMYWFLRVIDYRRWIFSCFAIAQQPDSPIAFAWVIRDCINQDALLRKGREPQGSGGGWAFLQRRSREAFLRPPRNWPWQLWRRLLCKRTASLLWHKQKTESLWIRWVVFKKNPFTLKSDKIS